VSAKYLRAVPVDPFTNSTDTWQTTLSELDPANPSAVPGIFDVRSGSDRMALDGTPYSTW
jgi:general secretion pathway protein G